MITDQYIVYGGQYTRTGLVLPVLDYAQLNYRVELLDLAAGEHKSPDFLKLNPAGFVPAMQLPDGEVMHETPAIMLYLAETHGLAELLPEPGARDRAQFLTGLFFCTNDRYRDDRRRVTDSQLTMTLTPLLQFIAFREGLTNSRCPFGKDHSDI